VLQNRPRGKLSLTMTKQKQEYNLSPDLRALILKYQTIELTEYHLYKRLANYAKNTTNQQVLLSIAEEELKHYNQLREVTGQDVKPLFLRLMVFYWIARLLSLTFALKLMEKGEDQAQKNYKQLLNALPFMQEIMQDEANHEDKLLGMIEEEHLEYVGSVVLGLNDALVELTGALAGLTLALQNGRLIAASGIIVGVAAALSMAASEYLSTKAESLGKNPLKSAIYTGLTYILTVTILVLPYLLIEPPLAALGLMLLLSLLIIAGFNFYVSISLDRPFLRQFLEMMVISFGVAAFSFALGYVVQTVFGVEVK